VTITGKDEVASLLHTLVAMRDSLTRVVSSVRQGAEGVATASSEIAQGNQDLCPYRKPGQCAGGNCGVHGGA
jgi:methyl-accepting chemotaxis protein-1 (serine sensor receptor)